MALKISFNLKSGNSENAQLIASLSFGYKEYDELKKTSVYKPLRFYTDIRIKRSHWSQEDRLPMILLPEQKLSSWEERSSTFTTISR